MRMARIRQPKYGSEYHQRKCIGRLMTSMGIIFSAIGILSLFETDEGLGGVSNNAASSRSSLQGLLDASPRSPSSASSSTLSSPHVVKNADIELESWRVDDPWKPVDCVKLLEQTANGTSEYPDPNNGQLYARLTKTVNPFYISMHNKEFDTTRFVVFDYGYYYEKLLTKAFREILAEAPPNARVIDVGGNIGWFTLLSASVGHHVDVFEANMLNVYRACQSTTLLNRWPTAVESNINTRQVKQPSVNIHHYGVADKPSTMNLYFNTNPGAGSFVTGSGIHPSSHTKSTKMSVEMVTLDQMATDLHWFDDDDDDKKPNIAIMKIDVEGFEPNVVAGAKQLLRRGLVANILMEMTGDGGADTANIQMIRDIVDAGFDLFKIGHFQGPRGPPPKSLPPRLSKEYPEMVVKALTPTKGKQINMWWKYQSQP